MDQLRPTPGHATAHRGVKSTRQQHINPNILLPFRPFANFFRCFNQQRAQDENLHLPGRAELPLCPEFLGGAAAPPYRRHEDFGPAPTNNHPVAAVYNRRILSYGAVQLPIASSPPFPLGPSE